MTKNNRFAHGSGVFTCQCCERKTRATNRDHAQTGNCALCFELAGIENTFSDTGDDAAVYADYGAEARRYLKELESKGGSLDNWRDLIALLDACEKPAPVAPVLTKTYTFTVTTKSKRERVTVTGTELDAARESVRRLHKTASAIDLFTIDCA